MFRLLSRIPEGVERLEKVIGVHIRQRGMEINERELLVVSNTLNDLAGSSSDLVDSSTASALSIPTASNLAISNSTPSNLNSATSNLILPKETHAWVQNVLALKEKCDFILLRAFNSCKTIEAVLNEVCCVLDAENNDEGDFLLCQQKSNVLRASFALH